MELMRPFPPLGIQYLVSWFRRETSFAVDWYDATFENDEDSFYQILLDQSPRVVGLYGHTLTRTVALEMSRKAEECGCVVIAGGPDPAQYAEEYLNGGVDILVVGEGEHTLQEVMEHLKANRWIPDPEILKDIHGLIFKDPAGAIHTTPPRKLIRPLDILPYPHRNPKNLNRYFNAWRDRHGETALSMNTSRGCPFHCTWCSKQVYGDTFRRRNHEKVVDEVLYLRETFDPDQIWFVDDVFTLNRAWVHRFCTEMVRREATIPFYLVARPETVDKPMLEALKNAGCYRIYFSAESGVQHVLDAMNKHTKVEDIYRACALCKELGIEIGLFVMLGYPGENFEDIQATLWMLNEIQPEVLLLSVAHPMKGTTFYDSVASQIVTPAGWAEENGGRLAFKMRFPHEFYTLAQKHIWNETELLKGIKQRHITGNIIKTALKYPPTRLMFEWKGRELPWPSRISRE